MDNFNGLVKSSENFLKSALKKGLDNNNDSKNNPVDILKRLQRETFSEIMKLKDKQEKLEKTLFFQKITKNSPFEQNSTQIKTIFNIISSLVIFEDDFLESTEKIERSGPKTGISSKFEFETVFRERDNLIAEFGTTGFGSLGLNRLMYNASLNNFLNLVLVPFGAKCNNFRTDSNFKQGHSDDIFTNGPLLFQQFHDCAIGITLKGKNFSASLNQLISGPLTLNSESDNNCNFTTFGEIAYKPLEDLKISLSGLWQIHKPSSHLLKISNLSFPLYHFKKSIASDVLFQSTGTETGTNIGTSSSQSMALIINGEYLNGTKLEGWVEIDNPLNENFVKFGGSFCDLPENELGWGLRSSGVFRENLSRLERFQMEGFLNFEIWSGGNAKLQPGVLFVSEGGNRVGALVLRSCWFM